MSKIFAGVMAIPGIFILIPGHSDGAGPYYEGKTIGIIVGVSAEGVGCACFELICYKSNCCERNAKGRFLGSWKEGLR